MICSQCRFENPPDMRYCGGCGSSLTPACSRCGAEVPAGFRFCGHCGAAVAADQDAPEVLADSAERRQITVMFCDLVESTELSVRVDPEVLRDVIRAFQKAAASIVEGYGGHIAQYLGDGLLIYFGFPRAHEDDAERAVRSSLETVAAIAELSRELETSRHISLQVRIGVHTGAVVAGDVGAGERTDRLALGSTPNLAARVQAVAQGGEVLLTATTHDLVQAHIETESIGEHDLRGFDRPMELFRAIRRTDIDELVDEEQYTETPFVGRADELQLLFDRLAQAERSEAQLVMIRGEPGIGKTRLQQEFRRSAGERISTLTRFRCSAFHQNTALWPVITFFERALGFNGENSAEARLAKLHEFLAPWAFPDGEAGALLADLLGLEGVKHKLPASAEWRRRRLMTVLADLIVGSGADLTTVFMAEDLHWADPSTLELLGIIAERAEGTRTLITFSFRSEFEPAWNATISQTLIEPKRLTNQQSAELVNALGLLSADAREVVVARTDGIPLFVEELTRSVASTTSEGRSDRFDADLIPITLRDSLMARLDSLGRARELVQLGALLGRSFRFDVILAVSNLPEESLISHLNVAAAAGLIYRRGEVPAAQYSFRHALIQDTAYSSLLRSRRKQLHNRTINVLKKSFPEVVGSEPESAARHCIGAELYSDAVKLYFDAGRHDMRRWAYVEAINHFDMALDTLERIEPGEQRDNLELGCLRALVVPLTANSGYTHPRLPPIYRRSWDLVKQKGSPHGELLELFRIWGFHCVRGDLEETRETYDEMARLAQSSTEPLDQSLLDYVEGSMAFYNGEQSRALESFAPAVESFFSDGAKHSASSPLFLAGLSRSWSLALAGRFEQAWRSIDQVLKFAEETGNPFGIAQALDHQITIAIDLALEPDRIESMTERLTNVAAEWGLSHQQHSSVLYRGWVAACRGEADGLNQIQGVIEEFRNLGSENYVANSLTILLDASLRLDSIADIEAAVDQCLDLYSHALNRHHEPFFRVSGGVLAARRGDREDARRRFDEVKQEARRQGQGLYELRAAVENVRCLGSGFDDLRAVVDRIEKGVDSGHLQDARALLEAEGQLT